MKLLLIHSDYIEYEVKYKAIIKSEETDKKYDGFQERLTVFNEVEKVNEKKRIQVVKQILLQKVKTAERLKFKNFMPIICAILIL